MQLLTPITPDPAAPLARANPVAKLAAALALLVALFASVDAVTAGTILVVLVALVPFSGLDWRALLSRSWPIGLMALAIAALNTILAPAQAGAAVLELGPLRVGAETLAAGLALGLRLLAIGAAGLLATATTQPIDLSDALVQQLNVSPRFAVGTLAALRLVPTLARDWQTAGLARRARGVDSGGSPLGAARLFAGLVVGLLVAAVRRGGRMALAMESRGFGTRSCRTVARVQRMRSSDWAWIGGGVGLAVGAVALSLWLGTWRPLIG